MGIASQSVSFRKQQAFLQRAKNDLATAQSLLVELIQSRNKSSSAKQQTILNHPFPLTAFVSMFGAPGFQHGYGHHHAIHQHHNHSIIASQIHIDSINGLIELLGSSKVSKLGLTDPIQLNIKYDRCNEIVTAFEVKQTIITLKSLWGNHQSSAVKATSLGGGVQTDNNRGPIACLNGTVVDGDANVTGHAVEESNASVTLCSGVDTRTDRQKRRKVDYAANDDGPWTCLACTYTHDESKQIYLACEVCGTVRT